MNRINCHWCNKETTNPKFCCKSCSAKANNAGRPYRNGNRCGKCTKLIYAGRIYCDDCYNRTAFLRDWDSMSIDDLSGKTLNNKHSTLRNHSRKKYNDSACPKFCVNCGYSKYYEVCHIKSIKDFPTNALLAEINHIDNLIALCRNCHWEFDRGDLTIEEINTGSRICTGDRPQL